MICALKKTLPDLISELVIIQTSGDWKPQQGEIRLCEGQGGKGLFAREIEAALLDRRVDIAVHSLKDMPSFLPQGLVLDAMLPRENPFDALVCEKSSRIQDLPEGAVIGTSSLRRQAFLLAHRPDLQIVPFRGNVQTRIDKLKGGQVDATFLAMAGLARLGIHETFIHPLGEDIFLPACGQGTIAVEVLEDQTELRQILVRLHDTVTGLCSLAEREALKILDGSCHTPIGAYATRDGEDTHVFRLRVAVAWPDGHEVFEEAAHGALTDNASAIAFGRSVAERLKKRLPEGILS